jgi:hypothetical protein
MSDIPEGYYVGHTGEILLDFRRDTMPLYGLPKPKARRVTRKAKSLKIKLLNRDGNLCHYCKQEMIAPVVDEQPTKKTYTLEHVVPRKMGGTNEQTNCVLACYKCNNKLGEQYIKCYCIFCATARKIYESNPFSKIYLRSYSC